MAFTAQEIYYKLLQKAQKNNTEFNIAIDKPRAVALINEAKHNWAKTLIKKNKDSSLIEHIQELVVDKELLNPRKEKEYAEFDFTENLYETIGGYCLAKKDKCKQILRLREVKNQDKQLLYFDSGNEPSFEYEWSYYTYQDNKIRVYTKDFVVLSTTIEYYRFIEEFDIDGYIKMDGSNSTDSTINLPDDNVDQIINEAVKDYFRITENQVGFQLSGEKVNKDN